MGFEPEVDVINKFYNSVVILFLKKAISWDVESHVTSFYQ